MPYLDKKVIISLKRKSYLEKKVKMRVVAKNGVSFSCIFIFMYVYVYLYVYLCLYATIFWVYYTNDG